MTRYTGSVLRIIGLIALMAARTWGATDYSDTRAFWARNSMAIALCNSLTPGTPAGESQRLTHATPNATVAMINCGLAIQLPGQALCFVEYSAGRVRAAYVARSG